MLAEATFLLTCKIQGILPYQKFGFIFKHM
jgi:hypothetical protein